MAKTLVIVADSCHARLFEYENLREIKELDTIIDPLGRLHNAEIAGSTPGRVFDSNGKGRHAMEPRSTPKDNEAEIFIRELSEFLEKSRSRDSFQKLAIIAAPRTLGRIRNALSPVTQGKVVYELNKDLSRENLDTIIRHLPKPSLVYN